jgi:hypothetical protein
MMAPATAPRTPPPAGAEAPRAHGGGHEIEDVGCGGERAQDGQGAEADPREAVDPGREDEAGEDQDRAGQARQHRAGDADQDQPDGEDPEDERAGRPVHREYQPRRGVTTSFQTRRAPAAL